MAANAPRCGASVVVAAGRPDLPRRVARRERRSAHDDPEVWQIDDEARIDAPDHGGDRDARSLRDPRGPSPGLRRRLGARWLAHTDRQPDAFTLTHAVTLTHAFAQADAVADATSHAIPNARPHAGPDARAQPADWSAGVRVP